MPSQEEFDELKGRIVELENALKGGATAGAPDAASLTPEDLATFQKVKAVLGTGSGYPTPCEPCAPCYPCYPCYHCYCATECTCAPCIKAAGGGGFGRFGGLGA